MAMANLVGVSNVQVDIMKLRHGGGDTLPPTASGGGGGPGNR
eukprot:CAMPEP_0178646112 /NCGR_PEP_ID=MMETSP0698-20121128/19199_1 /TAXON_ID=265572 /ORGANISM="Extubocellulus spinifer, Strain CCMP396" /LENGTH=41 /DNA_ID= /DNA_START= /DNA_END= /DNA_ORIENTATION=